MKLLLFTFCVFTVGAVKGTNVSCKYCKIIYFGHGILFQEAVKEKYRASIIECKKEIKATDGRFKYFLRKDLYFLLNLTDIKWLKLSLIINL